MLIQDERVNYLNTEKIMNNIFEDSMHVKRQESLANAALGMDRYVKANTVKHRTMSLFRQGCHYYNQMINMTNSELGIFFNCFIELLKEHKNLEEILWVI